ncbi:Fe-S cluster assembly ATPase SufC [Candidatus Dojkabacteria bacterium]|uniref:Fe-S cluster assembly ATPase SufC n=1 Tax=Candidatus Dojkabacteria bacterium TaxID=2099670 RepID=A0A5C7J498_9BACT|nr:MAG: Fe-S cluster assembly ATPase SufC [Candidatus Dojkabacteria bacterium]
MLHINNLTSSIGEKTILSNIEVSFEDGKVYAIMGPNGSGKSTLAASIMGHPLYTLSDKSKIVFNGTEIHDEETHVRAKRGIFLSFQSPLTLSGVNVFQLLRVALDGAIEPLELKNKLKKTAAQLKVKEELLSRSLNDGFSGGEKKKMEILQAAIVEPSFLMLDEIDTGVDVDSLKTIAEFLTTMKNKNRTIVVITHYNRILKYLIPDEVLVIKDGKLATKGSAELAQKIESEGYSWIK